MPAHSTDSIKREIGHLCHDETPGKGHGHAHHAMPKNKPPTAPSGSASSPLSQDSKKMRPSQPANLSPGSNTTQITAMRPLPPSAPPSSVASLDQPSHLAAASTGAAPGRLDALQAYISALTQAQASASAGPYSSQSPAASMRISADRKQIDASDQSTVFRASAGPAGPRQSFGGLSSDPLGSLVMGAPSPAVGTASEAKAAIERKAPSSEIFSNGPGKYGWPNITSSAAGLGGAGFLGLGGSDGMSYGGTGGGGDAAGGHEFNLLSEFLESLNGPANLSSADMTTSGSNVFATAGFEAAPSLGGAAPWAASPARGQQILPSAVQNKTQPSRKRLRTPPEANAAPSTSAMSTASSPNKRVTAIANSNVNANGHGEHSAKSAFDQPTLKGFSTKTEKFFLTAADQVDGPRDERLSKVIQAKYDAGLLRPYNHVKGYARLSAWMDRNVSTTSRRRIFKTLSIFRPRFRAVAQSLSDVDLIYIEEAFERLLLDYDRVFSTQGIPSCLWRRTGEIYKGNREFAELVGVGIEELREGKMGIYELMEEESACNYWEKYGAVSFDPRQKAVLTSCVLIARQGAATGGAFARNLTTLPAPSGDGSTFGAVPTTASMSRLGTAKSSDASDQQPSQVNRTENATSLADATSKPGMAAISRINCCFSFTIRRDAYGCPILVAGNFLPTR